MNEVETGRDGEENGGKGEGSDRRESAAESTEVAGEVSGFEGIDGKRFGEWFWCGCGCREKIQYPEAGLQGFNEIGNCHLQQGLTRESSC